MSDQPPLIIRVVPPTVPTTASPYHSSATHVDALGMPVRIYHDPELDSDFPYHPTPCCGASASISDPEYGMYCKGCYEQIDDAFGNVPLEPFRPIEEVLAMTDEVTIDRPCTFCGREVTSTKPDIDYCEMCFYTGRSWERTLDPLIQRIQALAPDATVGVWHTGGGCFNLAVTLPSGALLTPSIGTGDGEEWFPEPGFPTQPDERWCLVVSETEQAWSEWDEDKITFSGPLTEDELVEAIKAEVERPAPLIAWVANVIGEDLIDEDMPVEQVKRLGLAPLRIDDDEPLLVLYGDRETGVTVVVAAPDENEVERAIIATFGLDAHIDCIDRSADQRPLMVNLVAGRIENAVAAWKLLELDAANAAAGAP